ncbi:MAG: serine hydrolase domain-containing protein [Pseudomonadota bacterium]
MIKQIIAVLLAAGSASSCVTPQITDNPRLDRLNQIAPALLTEHDVPAVGVAVANSEGVIFAATYGESRPGQPATTETLFNVASVTKMLSAETVLRLAATGAFDIDEPMAPTWIDPDVVDDPRAQRLTPRHALAHQTGFPNWRSSAEDKRLAFSFDPGTRPGYSGEGFQYVARFAEKVADQSFPDLVKETVLDPAGAEQVVYGAVAPFPSSLAWSQDGEGNFRPIETWPTWSAADDLYVTPTAFAAFISTLIDGTSLPNDLEADRRRIQFDMTEQFCGRPALQAICPSAIGFGLSGVVFEYDGETVFWQGGGDVGERAVAFYVPEEDLGVVIFTNGANGAKLFAPIAELFYDNRDYIDFLRVQGEQG